MQPITIRKPVVVNVIATAWPCVSGQVAAVGFAVDGLLVAVSARHPPIGTAVGSVRWWAGTQSSTPCGVLADGDSQLAVSRLNVGPRGVGCRRGSRAPRGAGDTPL